MRTDRWTRTTTCPLSFHFIHFMQRTHKNERRTQSSNTCEIFYTISNRRCESISYQQLVNLMHFIDHCYSQSSSEIWKQRILPSEKLRDFFRVVKSTGLDMQLGFENNKCVQNFYEETSWKAVTWKIEEEMGDEY